MPSDFPFFEAPDSERLICWRAAYDAFNRTILENYQKGTKDNYRINLRNFFRETKKVPWEITAGDVEETMERFRQVGRKAVTINKMLSQLARFYRYCREKGIDPEWAGDGDPTSGVPRNTVNLYGKAVVLSTGEIQALLGVMRAEPAIISRRDYAFTLTRLLLGDRGTYLLRMTWGSLSFQTHTTWFCYQKGGVGIKRQMPEPAWQAIKDYLEASGRLAHIQAEEYIFAPLANPLKQGATGENRDWDGSRFLPGSDFGKHLKKFGRAAGIPAKRVSLASLRNTAIMLRKEAGANLEELMEFTGTRLRPTMRRQINALEASIYNQVGAVLTGSQAEVKASDEVRGFAVGKPLSRLPHHGFPGEIYKHGFRRRAMVPYEEIAPILAEKRADLDVEIETLRELNGRLFAAIVRVSDWSTRQVLAQTYAQSIMRLSKMISINQENLDRSKPDWLDDFYQIAVIMMEWGEVEPHELENFPWGSAEGAPTGPAEQSGIMQEEIACLRFILQAAYENVERLKDPADLMRMVDGYGLIGVKLAHLLAVHSAGAGDLERLREGEGRNFELKQ